MIATVQKLDRLRCRTFRFVTLFPMLDRHLSTRGNPDLEMVFHEMLVLFVRRIIEHRGLLCTWSTHIYLLLWLRNYLLKGVGAASSKEITCNVCTLLPRLMQNGQIGICVCPQAQEFVIAFQRLFHVSRLRQAPCQLQLSKYPAGWGIGSDNFSFTTQILLVGLSCLCPSVLGHICCCQR